MTRTKRALKLYMSCGYMFNVSSTVCTCPHHLPTKRCYWFGEMYTFLKLISYYLRDNSVRKCMHLPICQFKFVSYVWYQSTYSYVQFMKGCSFDIQNYVHKHT